VPLSRSGHAGGVTRIELIPTPNGDGTVALRAAPLGLGERVRRLWRRLLTGK
jgi:hypothetical protein